MDMVWPGLQIMQSPEKVINVCVCVCILDLDTWLSNVHVYLCSKLQINVHGYVCVCVCVCALRESCTVLSHAAGIEQREWANVLTTAVNEKKRRWEKKRSAVKVAEAYKRKGERETERGSLLSLIRVSASSSSSEKPLLQFLLLDLLLYPLQSHH